MEEPLEYVLLSKKECFAYAVPPATSSGGFKASDWGNCIWKGRCQVCSKGDILVIKLVEPDGQLFAACPIPLSLPLEASIERTTDSSRFFVLKLERAGRKVLMGFGFEQRNDAFDFNATIQDFRAKPPPVELPSFSHTPRPVRPIFSDNPVNLPEPPAGRKREPVSDDFADFGDFQAAGPSSSLLDYRFLRCCILA